MLVIVVYAGIQWKSYLYMCGVEMHECLLLINPIQPDGNACVMMVFSIPVAIEEITTRYL